MPYKTIVITGTTSGIGMQTALALAAEGHTIYMLVRDVEKGEQVQRNILVQTTNTNIHVVPCDLNDMESVRQAIVILKATLVRINVLINNAGGIFQKHEYSKNGFEKTFAINHLGHFLLTLGLIPQLERGHARIINVSSEAHKAAKINFDDLQFERSYRSIRAYGNAKLFNIYFAQSLAEKYKHMGITAYSLHPGVVDSQFWSRYTGLGKLLVKLTQPIMVTAQQGAETSVYLALEPNIENLSGQYFKNKTIAQPAANTRDAQARKTLWDKSMELVKAYL